MAKKKIAFIIDSGTSRDKKFFMDHNVFMIPLQFIDAENNASFEDTEEQMSQTRLVSELNKGKIYKTSLSNAGHFMALIEKLLNEYEDVIFLPISYGISGQWQMANNVLKPEFGKHFHIVKSPQASVTNLFIVHKMVEWSEKGFSAEEIVTKAEDYANNHEVEFFSLTTLKGMIRGGRVSKLKGLIASMLGIMPILSLNGEIKMVGKGKGMKVNFPVMLSMVKEYFAPFKPEDVEFVGIMNSVNMPEKDTNDLIEQVSKELGIEKEQVYVRNIPNTVLVHTLDGAYGIGVGMKTKKDPKFADK